MILFYNIRLCFLIGLRVRIAAACFYMHVRETKHQTPPKTKPPTRGGTQEEKKTKSPRKGAVKKMAPAHAQKYTGALSSRLSRGSSRSSGSITYAILSAGGSTARRPQWEGKGKYYRLSCAYAPANHMRRRNRNPIWAQLARETLISAAPAVYGRHSPTRPTHLPYYDPVNGRVCTPAWCVIGVLPLPPPGKCVRGGLHTLFLPLFLIRN